MTIDVQEIKAKALAVQTWWNSPIKPQATIEEEVAESHAVMEAFRTAANHAAIGELIALLERVADDLPEMIKVLERDEMLPELAVTPSGWMATRMADRLDSLAHDLKAANLLPLREPAADAGGDGKGRETIPAKEED